MAIPFADILQDRDLPVHSVGVNMHFNDIVFYALSVYALKGLRTEVYFCHQNQNENNIGNFTTSLKAHNIGTHLKIIFEILPLLGELYITFF
jgi:hypothetical protein